jgi:UDP-glucose 4-epimerase
MTTERGVLVTGGAGFIGSNLVGKLVERGYSVTVLDNLVSGYLANLEPFPSIRFVRGDVRDAAAVEAAMSGCGTIFHLAASVGNKRSIDFPLHDAEVNVLGTLTVLESARAAGARKVILSSSAGIFGEIRTTPIREDHPAEPDSPYGCTKLCAEKLALAYAKLYGMEVVCLRYFNVFGPNQRFDAYGNVIPVFVFQALRHEPITVHGDGEQTRDFVHVDDVVQANISASETAGCTGAFNIGSGCSISINELVRVVAELSGLDLTVLKGPPRPGDVRHSVADVSAAHRAFSYTPRVGAEAGLADYVTWAAGELAR